MAGGRAGDANPEDAAIGDALRSLLADGSDARELPFSDPGWLFKTKTGGAFTQICFCSTASHYWARKFNQPAACTSLASALCALNGKATQSKQALAEMRWRIDQRLGKRKTIKMCGRITLRRPDRVKIERLNTRALFDSLPRYNIVPTQNVWAVTEASEERSLSLLQWGLIPSWSKKPVGFINARAETLQAKPSFTEAFLRRRCLIAADGFYEWEKLGRAKQPHYFQMKNEAPFFFAGIWDQWELEKVSIASCAIVTTAPNKLLAEIHDRMPVILSNEAQDIWLRSNAKPSELRQLLTPFPESQMQGFPVGPEVNSSQIDHARLVERLEPSQEVRNGMLF